MRSSFFEFQVATTALHTARMGLSVTNHNMANSAIKGYSRQYAEIRANKPFSASGRGMIGTGSEVYGVAQIRDIYLDKKYWSANSVLGEYDSKRVQLDYIEKIFNGLSETGLNATFESFFNSIQELSRDSGDGTYRVNTIRAAESLATQINELSKSLQSQQTDINADIGATVQMINGLGQQIKSLNEQIKALEMDGSSANDLRDARANLIDELSVYVNVEVREVEKNDDYAAGLYPGVDDRSKSQKEFTVLINGYTFINNFQFNPLRVEKREEKLNPMDAGDLYDIYFENTNQKFDMYHPNLKGELKGLIDARDGNNGYHFSTTSTSTMKYNSTDNSITITNPNRADLNKTGYLAIKDPTTGFEANYHYNDFTLNNDGSVTFKFDDPLPGKINDTYLNNPKTEITVGKTTNYKGIPHYMDRLNNLVRTFAKAMNEGRTMEGKQIDGVIGHVNGYDLYGNTGNLFFSYDGVKNNTVDYNVLNSMNFQVDSELLKDPKRIAAAKNKDADQSENEVLSGLLKLNSTKALFAEGKIYDYLVGMQGELGIDLKQATNFTLNYTEITITVDNQRKSVSGVDMSEEMLNMVKYQQLFTAAAKLINIIDGIYNTTINGLGKF